MHKHCSSSYLRTNPPTSFIVLLFTTYQLNRPPPAAFNMEKNTSLEVFDTEKEFQNDNPFTVVQDKKICRTFFIRHSIGLISATVVDLTPLVEARPLTDELHKEVRGLIKASRIEPYLVATKKHLLSLRFLISKPNEPQVAEWKAACWSPGTSQITFASQPLEPVVMKPKSMFCRDEKFEYEGVTYTWKSESWCQSRMTLYKHLASEKGAIVDEVVGRFRSGWSSCSGGTLVLEKGVDDVVGIVTLLVMFKKRRQRANEHSGSS